MRTTDHMTARQGRTASDRQSGTVLDADLLRQQNRTFAGTNGVSANARRQGFVPGYLDTRSGTAVESRFSDGRPAPVHVLEGLPDEWVAERNANGLAIRARRGIVAGFIRQGRFFSRSDAALALAV